MAVTRSAEDTQTGLVAPSKTWLVACMQLKQENALSLLLLKASAPGELETGDFPKRNLTRREGSGPTTAAQPAWGVSLTSNETI